MSGDALPTKNMRYGYQRLSRSDMTRKTKMCNLHSFTGLDDNDHHLDLRFNHLTIFLNFTLPLGSATTTTQHPIGTRGMSMVSGNFFAADQQFNTWNSQRAGWDQLRSSLFNPDIMFKTSMVGLFSMICFSFKMSKKSWQNHDVFHHTWQNHQLFFLIQWKIEGKT